MEVAKNCEIFDNWRELIRICDTKTWRPFDLKYYFSLCEAHWKLNTFCIGIAIKTDENIRFP
jgi:hypothetical protein